MLILTIVITGWPHFISDENQGFSRSFQGLYFPKFKVISHILVDQILIGTTNEKIREEALKQSWDLTKLRKDGMQF